MSEKDTTARVDAFGANRMPPRTQLSFLSFALAALQDTTVIMLVAASGASLGLAASTGAPVNDWIEVREPESGLGSGFPRMEDGRMGSTIRGLKGHAMCLGLLAFSALLSQMSACPAVTCRTSY